MLVIIVMIRALLADDDPLLLDVLTTIFEHLGSEVACATTGGELLDYIAGEEFDIIVTDVAMPWMSGLQVMHSARTAGLPCPVVVMTGLRDPHMLARVTSLGVGAVLLLKPFSLIELYAALKTAIAPMPLTLHHGAALG
jgi:two-component system, OmpR family, copper resistance phosphate regulon response regulator CusR